MDQRFLICGVLLLSALVAHGCKSGRVQCKPVVSTTIANAPTYGILTLRTTVSPFVGEVCSLQFTADGKTLIANTNFGQDYSYGDIAFIDIDKMHVRDYINTDPGYTRTAIMPDGTILALTRTPTHLTQVSIDFLQIQPPKVTETITHSTQIWNQMSLSSDGQMAAFSNWSDCRLYIYSFASRSVIKTIQTDRISSAAFQPGGTLLAIGNYKEVQLWDTQTWTKKATLPEPCGLVAFSRRGNLIFISSPDGESIWDVEKHAKLTTLHTRTKSGGAYEAAFSPDDRLVAVAHSWDGLFVWDTRTGQMVAHVPQNNIVPWSVAFSPDGKLLAAGSGDRWNKAGQGCVKLWDVHSLESNGEPHSDSDEHKND